jgi:ABC-type transport system substrate-binding protein
LMSEARSTNDKAERDDKYRQFQDIIEIDVPALFLVQNVFSYAQQEEVKGLSISSLPDSTSRFYDLPNWFIETKRVFQKD